MSDSILEQTAGQGVCPCHCCQFRGLTAVAAVDANWAIGRDEELLFRTRPDMRHFQRLTTGHTLVIGRKTLATLPRGLPLANRYTLILSRNPDLANELTREVEAAIAEGREKGINVAAGNFSVCGDTESLKAEIAVLQAMGEAVFVCGGASVYRLLLPYCHEAIITHYHHAADEADAFFPDLARLRHWRLTENLGEAEGTHEGSVVRMSFHRYTNTRPLALF
ncbi:MAG: dihydrofolate reductase [Clostridiaceae bacterium]|nr:dihydrofolate reductase [Clostridiaceae bacterium]